MITTDFKHPGIECFDEEAKKQETLILTELGEDPGLDNMGLKQMIDEVHLDENISIYKGLLRFAGYC